MANKLYLDVTAFVVAEGGTTNVLSPPHKWTVNCDATVPPNIEEKDMASLKVAVDKVVNEWLDEWLKERDMTREDWER